MHVQWHVTCAGGTFEPRAIYQTYWGSLFHTFSVYLYIAGTGWRGLAYQREDGHENKRESRRPIGSPSGPIGSNPIFAAS